MCLVQGVIRQWWLDRVAGTGRLNINHKMDAQPIPKEPLYRLRLLRPAYLYRCLLHLLQGWEPLMNRS